MSVVAKGMEMPESCGACKLSAQVSMSLGAVMRCRLVGVVGTSAFDPHDVFNKRHPNCPLVALPDKHGRLVDADALIADIRKNSASYFADDFAHEWADRQPTIIESEDGE